MALLTPEEKLGYAMTERTRFKIRIEFREGRDPLPAGPGVCWITMQASLTDCQRAYVTVRDAHCLGYSQFSDGEVYDEMGQHVARISYNGRLWVPMPWTPDATLVAEAPGRRADA